MLLFRRQLLSTLSSSLREDLFDRNDQRVKLSHCVQKYRLAREIACDAANAHALRTHYAHTRTQVMEWRASGVHLY